MQCARSVEHPLGIRSDEAGGQRWPGQRQKSELNKQIAASGVASDLCALIEAQAAAFGFINIATAFRKLLPARRAGPEGAHIHLRSILVFINS